MDLTIEAYGGTFVTKLHVMTLEYETFVMDPKHNMAGYLKAMSFMFRDLN